jgi:hypothetical protein
MTLAICIVCGNEKFGAFVPCQRCMFKPTHLADKAKSLMLSDHCFPPKELQRFSDTLRSHGEVPYDFVALAVVAQPIREETYYWEHLDKASCSLPCMRCGTAFSPSDEEVVCAPCYALTRHSMPICVGCSLVFDSGARYCHSCGAALRASPNLTVKRIASDMEIAIGRLLGTTDVLAKSNFLGEIRSKLSEEDRLSSERELETVAMCSAILALAKIVPSSSLLDRIKLEMVGIYGESFALRGAKSQIVSSIRAHCLSRLDEYTHGMARDPERWVISFGAHSAKNCFGVDGHAGATIDMTIVIGLFIRVLQSAVVEGFKP